jgi:Tfp pilus assembly protein PilO
MTLRKRVLITLGVTVVAAVAVAAAIGVPSVFAIKGLQKEINAAQTAIDVRVAMFRYLRKAAADLNDTQRRVATLSQIAVRGGHELEFITALEEAAAAAGVEQDIGLNTASQKEISSWERISPLQLQIKGTYPQVRDYISRLERMPYLIDVRSFSIMRTGKEDGESSVSATLSATVYMIGESGPSFTGATAK